MWRLWANKARNNPPRIHNTSSSSSSSSFSCSSFKDIQTLVSDQNDEPPSRRPPAHVFHRVRVASSLIRNWPSPRPPEQQQISLPGTEKRIVIYFTSLRAVRTTFLQCQKVLTIMRGFRVKVDERDLIMDSSFLRELQGIFGRHRKNRLNLPIVFIGGRYVGGSDEIMHLHETDELKNIIRGYPVVKAGVCDSCGGYKFILCDECSGSHKLYSSFGFRICTECNENGLIRCPSCAMPP